MTDVKQLIGSYLQRLEARDWAALESLLHPDLVYEMPQSRERIRGRDAYVQFNREYPGDWHVRARQIIAEPDAAVAWFTWTVGAESGDAFAFFTVTDGRVTAVTDFFPEPTTPRPGREHLVERW